MSKLSPFLPVKTSSEVPETAFLGFGLSFSLNLHVLALLGCPEKQ